MKAKISSLHLAIFLPAFCVSLATSMSAKAGTAKFAGVPVAPGQTVQAYVPLSAREKEYASDGGVAPAQAIAVIAVPSGFNPQKSWPVLIVFATDDFKRFDRDDLESFYRTDALASGWVVLAGDGLEYPHHGTSGWRAGMTLAALEALYRSFPGSSKWPVACAGYSGGAKQAGQLSPLFSIAGCKLIGLYLTGINVDRLTAGYRALKPAKSFLHTPVFISAGSDDKIAPAYEQLAVKTSLQRTGFDRVRFETFAGGHVVKRTHLREALVWFQKESAAP